MTKEEILAAAGFDNTPAGVAAFYKKFKSKEDFDNHMASGGSSKGAPTAKEFFDFGATTNLNIPFGNFAYGGAPCMDCGGYMSHGGFTDMLNSVTKQYKKDISKNTVTQGGNDLNPGQNMTMQFKNKLTQNFQMASLDEIHNEFKQMGGASFSTGIDYQNQAYQNMYQSKIGQYDQNLKDDSNNLFQALSQAQYGMPVGPNLIGGLSPAQIAALQFSSKYVGDNERNNSNKQSYQSNQNAVGNQQTQNPVPGAYANYYLQEYQNKHFGPWGKTRMTFGTGNPNQGSTGSYNQNAPVKGNPYGDHKYNPFQPATEDAGANSNESWFSRWRAAQQGKSEDRARAKKYNHRPEETQTGTNGAIYDYEKDMPTDYNPKKMTNWDWYNPDEPISKEFGGPMYQMAGAVQYDQFGNPIDPNKQMMKRNTFGSNATDNTFGTNNIFKGDAQRNTFGTPKPQQDIQNQQNPQNNSSFTVESKHGPQFGAGAADIMIAGINTAASAINKAKDKSGQQLSNLQLADNSFIKNPLNAQSQGDYDPNSGILRPDQYVPVQFYGQFGGENDLPMAREGLDLRAGLYGTNGNRQFSLPNRTQSTKFSEPLTDVRTTLQPVDRADANVEAEKKEQVVINIDNLPTNFKIGGERHSKGGTPLNLPDDSFIFSDTPKMVIKDPIILAQFGMIPKKSGYTPAEIAKKYDINKFRQVLANKDAEDLEKKTAEMMIANYNMKLAKLALLQESMKGFPQGIPKMAMPYVEANEINPQDLIGGANQAGPKQMDPNMESTEQGQSDEPDTDMGVSRFGGLVKAQDGHAVTKGFGAPLIRKSEGEFAAKYPAIYNAYMTALNNKDAAEMHKVADLIEKQQKTQTPWYSLDMIPGTDADMFENLSSVLKEEAAKISGNSSYKPEVIKSKYKDLPVKALGIYGKLKQEYAAIPKDDYMKLIEKDNQIKKIESYLPQNKARFLPESVKEPWQLYNKEDLTVINALFNDTFKPTSGAIKVDKTKVDNTTKPVEQKVVKAATQAEQQPANIEIKTKPAKATKSNKTSVDTFYVDDLSPEEKALLGLK